MLEKLKTIVKARHLLILALHYVTASPSALHLSACVGFLARHRNSTNRRATNRKKSIEVLINLLFILFICA